MLVKTYGSAVHGVDARTITIEVNAGGTLVGNSDKEQCFYQLVGLPDNAVREGFQRIKAAIRNIDYQMINVYLMFIMKICTVHVQQQ